MTIEHPDVFHGLTVLTLPQPDDPLPGGLPAADSVAWRLDCAWKELTFSELWEHFLGTVDPARVRALLIGPWWHDEYTSFTPVVEQVAADAHRFPALRALFLADVVGEECEVSWLEMCDITPLIEAFPLLEELTVRGGGDPVPEEEKLRLRPVRHDGLKSLRFESGGLPGHVVRAVGASELPALERLELWFGAGWYGGDATVEDMRPVLSGAAFPRLRHLGLQNSEIQDEIATAVASAPVVARLESLSLAMGTLGDAGAQALLDGQPLTHLTSLDLHHHYLTDPLVSRIRDLCARAGVKVDLEEADHWDPEDDESRYVAVSE
ncbi:STM4015 family protein [Streptomyces clavifer]|uniref:STM4015 family protein n=1 Tax=Streptomyces TaxID=1883 RepID=UPI0006FCF737|nr:MULTISPECIES: STM4015 family protein [unclassified Streptomyces]KQX92303.1 cytoplasmic protein [Streptomyces sp. Root1319]KQZ18642.1 cytoplasmic protein [Streptomyces sp. Root55]